MSRRRKLGFLFLGLLLLCIGCTVVVLGGRALFQAIMPGGRQDFSLGSQDVSIYILRSPNGGWVQASVSGTAFLPGDELHLVVREMEETVMVVSNETPIAVLYPPTPFVGATATFSRGGEILATVILKP